MFLRPVNVDQAYRITSERKLNLAPAPSCRSLARPVFGFAAAEIQLGIGRRCRNNTARCN
jgi:hypothetical protein